jgi:hypothetical protein
MLYIVGTDHCTQYVYRTDNLNRSLRVEEFAAYLRKEAIRLRIKLIAEELSQETVAKNTNRATSSNARRVALDLGVAHRFCDPDSDERRRLGIPSEGEIEKRLGFGRVLDHDPLRQVEHEERKYWPMREEFWLNCIRDRLQNRVLFVCGAQHASRFQDLVAANGEQVEVLIEDWYTHPRQITPH